MIQSELNNNALFLRNNKTDAIHIGLATYKHYLNKDFCSSNTIKPMYLKKSSAEV